MSLLVTGSLGIDSVTTPHGQVEEALGGTAVYFSFAASLFVPVRLVGVVGDDFPEEYHDLLKTREIDLAGLEVRKGSRTFRWTGRYEGDMNAAQTLAVDLNVLAEEGPKVPPAFADSKTVFLANTHPTLQRSLLGQLLSPQTVVCDTMDLWIETERDSLLETFALVTGVIINDGEARQLTGCTNLIEAGEKVLEMGPKFAIIKKGEHGALLITGDRPTAIPSYPAKIVRDPTGAGDSFAGGVMSFISKAGNCEPATLKRAMARGTISASFAIEDFSLRRVCDLSRREVEKRIEEYVEMLRLE